jgi:hypothetical protein
VALSKVVKSTRNVAGEGTERQEALLEEGFRVSVSSEILILSS